VLGQLYVRRYGIVSLDVISSRYGAVPLETHGDAAGECFDIMQQDSNIDFKHNIPKLHRSSLDVSHLHSI